MFFTPVENYDEIVWDSPFSLFIKTLRQACLLNFLMWNPYVSLVVEISVFPTDWEWNDFCLSFFSTDFNSSTFSTDNSFCVLFSLIRFSEEIEKFPDFFQPISCVFPYKGASRFLENSLYCLEFFTSQHFPKTLLLLRLIYILSILSLSLWKKERRKSTEERLA